MLPYYPYRDDGSLLYAKLDEFVDAYIDAYVTQLLGFRSFVIMIPSIIGFGNNADLIWGIV